MIAISRRRPKDGDHQRVPFEIRIGTRRVSCSLSTNFPTKEQAKRYFYANRPLIEQMARDEVEQGRAGSGDVTLKMA